MIAALYVAKGGCYFGLEGVDPWDEERDARLYVGPHRVVAHPPCQRWGKMYFGSPLSVKKGYGRKKLGADGGCFSSALQSVRTFGGVLEHPEGSQAWKYFEMRHPPRRGGWVGADVYGGVTCCVEQGRYGHYARKPTWLYAFGVQVPDLTWGKSAPSYDPRMIDRIGIEKVKRLGEVSARGSSPRIQTPLAFRDLLLSIASKVTP